MNPADLPPALAIVRLGLATPLGLSAPAALAAARAGIVRFCLTHSHDRHGEPIRASMLSRLDPSADRTARIAALAACAARDCLHGLSHPGPLPLYLALSEPDGPSVDQSAVMDALRACVPAQLELCDVVRAGRAGMFQLLARLADPPLADAPPFALVIAADSLCDTSTLHRLERGGRVLSARRDGLIPGEAAGAVLLARDPARERPPLAHVLACALGQLPPGPDRVRALADGLTDVFARLAGDPCVRGPRPHCVSSCQTGEIADARAFGYAALRQASLMPEPLVHLRACDSFGDAGAAAPALALALALHHIRAAAGRALFYGSAEGGAIGACLLDLAPAPPGAHR